MWLKQYSACLASAKPWIQTQSHQRERERERETDQCYLVSWKQRSSWQAPIDCLLQVISVSVPHKDLCLLTCLRHFLSGFRESSLPTGWSRLTSRSLWLVNFPLSSRDSSQISELVVLVLADERTQEKTKLEFRSEWIWLIRDHCTGHHITLNLLSHQFEIMV
jgi:hypothetical protein